MGLNGEKWAKGDEKWVTKCLNTEIKHLTL